MSSLKCYLSVLTSEQLQMLKERHILTVLDFIQESPENINKITNLHFKDILEMKEKLVRLYRGNPSSGLELFLKERTGQKTLTSGIPGIGELLGELELSTVYEICGLSGSGKTQICLAITAYLALTGHKVLYIDTKNEFNAIKVLQMICRRSGMKEDGINILKRVTVTKVNDLYQLISVLHSLKSSLVTEPTPFIVVDCISTLYFLSVGEDDNIGLGLLNHVALLVKHLKTEFHSIFFLTNLAAKYVTETDKVSCKSKIKPCLGNYWSQVVDIRIMTRKLMNTSNTIILEKDERAVHLDLNCL